MQILVFCLEKYVLHTFRKEILQIILKKIRISIEIEKSQKYNGALLIKCIFALKCET